MSYVLVPSLVSKANINNLQDTVNTIAFLYLGLVALAGLIAGICGSWQAGRAGQSSALRRIINGIIGAIVPIGLLLVVALLRHYPIPSGPTKANCITAVCAALVGALAVSAVHTPTPRYQVRRPARMLRTRMSAFGCLCVLAVSASSPAAAAGPAHAADPLTLASTYDSNNDIAPGDCVVSTTKDEGSATFTIFGIDLGPTFAYSSELLRDGTNEVDVEVGAKGGFTLSVGGKIGALLKGVGAGASVSTDATLTESSTYEAASPSDADSVIRWALNRFSASELALPLLASLTTGVIDARNAAKAGPPIRSELQLEGTLHVELDIPGGQNRSIDVETGAQASVVLENQNNKNRAFVEDPDKITLELGLSGNGEVSGLAPLGGGISGNVSGDGLAVVSEQFQKDSLGIWLPTTVSADVTAGLDSEAQLASAKQDLGTENETAEASKGLSDIGLEILKTTGASLQLSGEVDLSQHPEIFADWASFVASAHRALGSGGTQDDMANFRSAASRLASDLERDGTLSIEMYKVVQGSLGLDADWGEGITIGLSAEGKATEETLALAMYRPAGGSLGISHTCFGSGVVPSSGVNA